MPAMAGTLGLNSFGYGLGLWEGMMPSFAAPMSTFLEDWFALQYLLPLISFVCVGLEGWCFFDLTRKSLGARSARAIADARDAASLEDYDVSRISRGVVLSLRTTSCVFMGYWVSNYTRDMRLVRQTLSSPDKVPRV